MKDQFGNEVRLFDAVVFASCNEVRFGLVIGIKSDVIDQRNWETGKYEKKLSGYISVLYYGNNRWPYKEYELIKFSPRLGFTKIPREALPVAFNELLVKNGY